MNKKEPKYLRTEYNTHLHTEGEKTEVKNTYVFAFVAL
jgi:hypothetical protein